MPYIATFGLLLIPQIVLAVGDLNRELRAEAIKNPPKIIHKDNRLREPSRFPGILIGSGFIFLVLMAEGFAVERA